MVLRTCGSSLPVLGGRVVASSTCGLLAVVGLVREVTRRRCLIAGRNENEVDSSGDRWKSLARVVGIAAARSVLFAGACERDDFSVSETGCLKVRVMNSYCD